VDSHTLATPNPEPQHWLRLAVPVPYEAAEAVANFLVELGSLGAVESERDFSQSQPALNEVQGFFPIDASRSALIEGVTQHLRELLLFFPSLGQPELQITEVSSESWADQWRGHFPPLAVGQRFLVLPPWETPANVTDHIPLIINPSMAFGTGHHATTQGCLEAIEALGNEHGPPSAALDLGTGSGILAIALAKLGTPTVWAIDIDPIALNEAQKNGEANQVAEVIHLSDAPLDQFSSPVPLLVANLFAITLVSLAPYIERIVQSGGYTILSGILLDQEPDILATYTPPQWRLVHRFPREEWVTLVCQRC
jgi:ribosomal protein L11 methyltransferase